MQNNKQQPQETKLRIQSSVYPEGWGTLENFNATFQHIFHEAERAAKDPRHFQSSAIGAFSHN